MAADIPCIYGHPFVCYSNGAFFITLMCPLTKALLCHSEVTVIYDLQSFNSARHGITVLEKTAVDAVFRSAYPVDIP